MAAVSYRIKHERFPRIKHDLIRKPLRGSLVVRNTACPIPHSHTSNRTPPVKLQHGDVITHRARELLHRDTIKPANLDETEIFKSVVFLHQSDKIIE